MVRRLPGEKRLHLGPRHTHTLQDWPEAVIKYITTQALRLIGQRRPSAYQYYIGTF